jgi:hypothetical protein
MKAYLSYQDDYETGAELIGVFETLDQAMETKYPDCVEMWDGCELKKRWCRKRYKDDWEEKKVW